MAKSLVMLVGMSMLGLLMCAVGYYVVAAIGAVLSWCYHNGLTEPPALCAALGALAVVASIAIACGAGRRQPSH